MSTARANKDDTRVLVFAKAPRPGEVKTRLIPLLGAERAATLHARLIERTLATARDAAFDEIDLYGTRAGDSFLAACAQRYGATLRAQCEGDLGARMQHAFEQALETSTRVILIGCDCPALRPDHLKEAAAALSHGVQAVFTPVEDGGYALVALRECNAHLFRAIAWSTASVMERTRERLRQLGWHWVELERLWDVDRPADYERFAAMT